MDELTARALRAMALDPMTAGEVARAVRNAAGRVPLRERDDATQYILMCVYKDVAAGARDAGALRMRAWSAMRDYGRSQDPLSRGQRKLRRSAEAAYRDSVRDAAELRACEREADVARRLGLEVGAYRARLADTAVVFTELTETAQLTVPADAEAAIERGELARAMARALDGLPARERMVIEHLLSGGDHASLAGALDVTSSRISQLRRQAIERLRAGWGLM